MKECNCTCKHTTLTDNIVKLLQNIMETKSSFNVTTFCSEVYFLLAHLHTWLVTRQIQLSSYKELHYSLNSMTDIPIKQYIQINKNNERNMG